MTELKRSMTIGQLVAIGIGAIIGAGIFVLTGKAAADHAGPAVVLSFLLAAGISMLAGLCYAELAAAVPSSGGAYSYVRRAFGDRIGWLAGYCTMLAYLIGAATVAVGFSGYLQSLLSGYDAALPGMLAAPLGEPVTAADGSRQFGLLNLPAVAVIGLMMAVLVLEVGLYARIASVMVIVKVAMILLFIGISLPHLEPANWQPFLPAEDAEGHFGWMGVVTASTIIFFSYVGFETVVTAAQESKNPQRDIPLGMLGALILCALLYAGVALVMTGLVPYHQLGTTDPLAVAIETLHMPWLSLVIRLGALVALASVALVNLYAHIRISYVMAKDGLLPEIFGRLDEKRQIPWANTLISGTLVAVTAGLAPIEILGTLVSIALLTVFILVAAALIRLRNAEPDLPRPFRTPLVPVLPVAAILSSAALILFADRAAIFGFVCLLVAGGLSFHYYRRRSSRTPRE